MNLAYFYRWRKYLKRRLVVQNLKMAWSRRFIPKLFVWHSSSVHYQTKTSTTQLEPSPHSKKIPSLLTHSMDRKHFDEVRKADHVCCEALLLFRWTTCCFYDQTALTSNKERPSHHQNNVIYQFVCHCDRRYVGRTSQRFEERIKQHIPKSITNSPSPHIRQSLPRPGKDTNRRQFHESAIGQHLL